MSSSPGNLSLSTACADFNPLLGFAGLAGMRARARTHTRTHPPVCAQPHAAHTGAHNVLKQQASHWGGLSWFQHARQGARSTGTCAHTKEPSGRSRPAGRAGSADGPAGEPVSGQSLGGEDGAARCGWLAKTTRKLGSERAFIQRLRAQSGRPGGGAGPSSPRPPSRPRRAGGAVSLQREPQTQGSFCFVDVGPEAGGRGRSDEPAWTTVSSKPLREEPRPGARTTAPLHRAGAGPPAPSLRWEGGFPGAPEEALQTPLHGGSTSGATRAWRPLFRR